MPRGIDPKVERLTFAQLADHPDILEGIVVRLWDETPRAIRLDQADWYLREYKRIGTIADALCFDHRSMVAVVAVLSPRVRWNLNLSAAIQLGAGLDHWAPLGASKAKARLILAGADPELVLGGPKVIGFDGSFLGRPGSIALDVWMARALTGDPGADVKLGANGAGGLTTARYRRIAETLGECIPRRLGLNTFEWQPPVWANVRGAA